MPFKRGNKLGGRKLSELEGVQQYLTYMATGAAREYFKNVERQFNGEELSEPVKEAMDRFEKNTEFIAPKLARVENSVDLRLNKIDGNAVEDIFGKITGREAGNNTEGGEKESS